MGKQIKNFPAKTSAGSDDLLLLQDAVTGAYNQIKVSDLLKNVPATTAPQDPYFNNVVLLLHFEGQDDSTQFVDVKGKSVTPLNNARLSTSNARFGNSSLYLDGNSYLEIPNSQDFLVEGPYTVEGWVYPLGGNYFNWIVNNGGVDGYNWQTWAINCYNQQFSFYGSSTNNGNDLGNNAAFGNCLINAWHHFAMCFDGSKYLFFADGQLGLTINNASRPHLTPYPLWIGTYQKNPPGPNNIEGQFYGYIDEIRLTKGVARYTQNFSPSSTAFPDF